MLITNRSRHSLSEFYFCLSSTTYALVFLASNFAEVRNEPMEKEMSKFDKLRVTPENYGKLKESHENIYYGALKALMGQLGKHHYKEISEAEKQRLARCLDRIENRNDLVSPAKCLIQSKLRVVDLAQQQKAAATRDDVVAFVQDAKVDTVQAKGVDQRLPSKIETPAFVQEAETSKEKKVEQNTILVPEKMDKLNRFEKLRAWRHMKKQSSKMETIGMKQYNLKKNKTPIATRLAKYGKEGLRRRMRRRVDDGMAKLIETRADREKWFQMARLGKWNLTEKEETREERFQVKSISSSASVPLSSRAEKPVTSRISNLLVKMMGEKGEKANKRWTKVHGMLERLADETERRKKFPGTKVFDKRMYDIVLDREEPSMSPKERRGQLGMLHEGIKLLDMLPGRNQQNQNASTSQNYRLFSPRFMPLAPDKGGKMNPKSLLSPTLFAMYEEKNNNSIANVPEILKTAGISEKDRKSIIAGLMDITGATDYAEQAMGMLKGVNFFENGVGGPILKATERTLNAFFALEDSLDGHQQRQCSKKGYTFARKAQIERLLRDQAIDTKQMPDIAKFDVYDRMSVAEKEMSLWASIEQIALGKPVVRVGVGDHQNNQTNSSNWSPAGHRRVKRTFAVHLFEPLILSPFQFAPVYGLVVMGPTILSPSTFSPYILAPSLFSPLILSPPIFSPLILAPSIASPWILTPGVGNPYIISPYIFGPFILGPLVLHPFILAPYIISPNILNPYVLSPIILNPIALSPDIMSPQILGGAIFSPAMLSPAILTQTYLMVSIYSPTFLS